MKFNLKDKILRADQGAYFRLDDDTDVSTDKSKEWERFGMRLAVSTTLHPFEYAKVLMQLGYEPIAAVPGRTLLGQNVLVLPNLFQYTGFIYKVDGFLGCFRGLAPKLIGSIASFVICEQIADHLGLRANCKEKCCYNSDEEIVAFKKNLRRDILLAATGIIVSHPFQVISIRMMSQFVGNETIYKTILASIFEIFKNDGWRGFFAGLVPRLICDVSCGILTSLTVFLFNKYVVKNEIGRQYNTGITQLIFSNLFYPLQVVSTCMIVNGSKLAIGRPPRMNIYGNWLACYRDLLSQGQSKRGSMLFMRYQEPAKKLCLTN